MPSVRAMRLARGAVMANEPQYPRVSMPSVRAMRLASRGHEQQG